MKTRYSWLIIVILARLLESIFANGARTPAMALLPPSHYYYFLGTNRTPPTLESLSSASSDVSFSSTVIRCHQMSSMTTFIFSIRFFAALRSH